MINLGLLLGGYMSLFGLGILSRKSREEEALEKLDEQIAQCHKNIAHWTVVHKVAARAMETSGIPPFQKDSLGSSAIFYKELLRDCEETLRLLEEDRATLDAIVHAQRAEDALVAAGQRALHAKHPNRPWGTYPNTTLPLSRKDALVQIESTFNDPRYVRLMSELVPIGIDVLDLPRVPLSCDDLGDPNHAAIRHRISADSKNLDHVTAVVVLWPATPAGLMFAGRAKEKGRVVIAVAEAPFPQDLLQVAPIFDAVVPSVEAARGFLEIAFPLPPPHVTVKNLGVEDPCAAPESEPPSTMPPDGRDAP